MPNQFVDNFAADVDALAQKMEQANFGRKAGTGFVSILRAMSSDMRKQSAGGSVPEAMRIEAMSAFADSLSASSNGEPRTDLPVPLTRLFASAAVSPPPAGKVYSMGEANEILNRAGIEMPQDRIAAKLQMEAAGLLPSEGRIDRRRTA